MLGLINFLCGFSSIRNHKLFAVYNLYLLKKKKCFCFNISAFYFYFGPLQVHVVWGAMNKRSLSLWYCWFSYGFSLLQAGNFSLFHGSSDRSYTILFILFIVFLLYFFLLHFSFWEEMTITAYRFQLLT